MAHDQVGDGTFELDRFAWESPDRLAIAGRFTGLGEVGDEQPVLLVHGADRTHELEAVPDTLAGAVDGSLWSATFAWSEPPAAFTSAELVLGGDVVVELPTPRPRPQAFDQRVFAVRRTARVAAGVAASGPQHAGLAERVPDTLPEAPAPAEPARGALQVEAELLEAREATHALEGTVARLEAELARARGDLDAEREARTADAERFRGGLARVQQLAEEAVAAERTAADDARATLLARDDENDALRAQLAELRDVQEAAGSDLARAQEELSVVRGAHDAAVAGLDQARGAAERAGVEAQGLRALAEGLRSELDDAQAAVEQAEAERDEARTSAERLAVERDKARSQAERLAAEVDEIHAAAERVVAERDAARADLAQLGTERDALRADAGRLEGEREELRSGAEQAVAERDAARARAERLEGELDDARGAHARLQGEAGVVRDRLAAIRQALGEDR